MKPLILAGIDFSDSSPLVLRHARLLAERQGARLKAVHVADAGKLSHRAASTRTEPDLARYAREAEERFNRIASELPPLRGLEFEVLSGRPPEELRKILKAENASLLVIAANDMTRERLGSTASQCVRTAPCDVLVLRDWQGGDFRHILVCTDFSSTSQRALEGALQLAEAHEATLETVHVVYPAGRDSWGEALEHEGEPPKADSEEAREHAEEEMRSFLDPQAGRLANLRHRATILESMHIAVALTEHIRNCGADLVVMGTRGHSLLTSHFLGTNAERLIADASVSVLAVREPAE